MDWIKITDHKPDMGTLIWGRDKTGRARLGLYGIDHQTGNPALKAFKGNILIRDLEKWATYDVEY